MALAVSAEYEEYDGENLLDPPAHIPCYVLNRVTYCDYSEIGK